MNTRTLAILKQNARKLGFATGSFDRFAEFYDNHELSECCESGKVMEIILAFVLGSIQANLSQYGIPFWIDMSQDNDERQIDFKINHAAIQLKFGYSDEDIEAFQDAFRFRNIRVLGIKKYKPGIDYDIIDTIVDILHLAGLNENEIECEIDEDPAFDLAYSLWIWYCEGIQ